MADSTLERLSFAQVPTQGELLAEKYEKDRINGLMRLNANYIRDFKEALVVETRAGNLNDANALMKRIKELEAENLQLQKALTIETEVATVENDNPLLGKTVHLPHYRDPDFTARLVFREKGRVFFIGFGNEKHRWNYEQSEAPLVYRVWYGADNGGGHVITLDDAGKETQVVWRDGFRTVGKVEDSTSEEAAAP